MIGTFASWEELARSTKEEWTRREGPDMPQVVIAERGGRPIAMAIMSACNRDDALQAAAMLRGAGDCDRIAMVNDTHFERSEAAPGGGPPRRKPGELQRRFQAGDPSVTEAVCCLAVARDLTVEAVHLPYRRSGRRVHWLGPIPAGGALQGYLPDALRAIMAAPAAVDRPDSGELAELAGRMGLDRGRLLWHMTRIVLGILSRLHCRVFDYITADHPEWVELEGDPADVAFLCPRCGRASSHPEDARRRWCGACGRSF
jgi:ribosomal protein S27AE